MVKKIFVVSDGTGETAAQMIKAAMVQFSDQKVQYQRFQNVRSKDQLEAILEEAEPTNDLIVYTLVSPELRSHLKDRAMAKQTSCVDLLGPLLVGLASHFGFEPKSIAGLLHNVNEEYFKRIEAIEYTVQHDDGRDLSNLGQADLVLLGVSRASKTPLSMYLGHQGWRVVNIPIIRGFEVPPELLEIDQRRIVALTIDPEDLATIRRNRLNRLGQDKGGDYADLEKVNEEIHYANDIFKKNRRWAVFNVTGKALEETAAEIIKLMASRRLTPEYTLENTPSIK